MTSLLPEYRRTKSLAIFMVTISIMPIILCSADTTFSQTESEVIADVSAVPNANVVAFGRLLPQDEEIALSIANAEDSLINEVVVKKGDWVEVGQVVALLPGIERRQRNLEQAKQNVVLHAAKLKKIESEDIRKSEIAAQEAVIDVLQTQLRYETKAKEAALNSVKVELEQTKLLLDRQDYLQRQGAISQEEVNRVREQFQVATAILNQRRAELNSTIQTIEKQIIREQKNLAQLREVRPADLEIVKAELAMARIAVKQRQADLEDTQVRVPVAGRILSINTRVGERVDTEKSIIELGQTNKMYAIAEIGETEVSKISLGQKAIITSEYGGFTEKIAGTVADIGSKISKRSLSGNSADSIRDENARVVKIKIRIDDKDSNKVNALTNMQVRVAIDTAETSAAYLPPKITRHTSDTASVDRTNPSSLNLIHILSLAVGILSLVALTKLLKAKFSSSSDNSVSSDRETLYLSTEIDSKIATLETIEQLKEQLYLKIRAKQIAIATAEVELKQTQAEYLSATFNLQTEMFAPEKLNHLKQKLLAVQNNLAQQESQLDREISYLRNQIAQTGVTSS